MPCTRYQERLERARPKRVQKQVFPLRKAWLKTAAASLVFAGSSEAPATSGLVEALQIPFLVWFCGSQARLRPRPNGWACVFSGLGALYLDVQFTMTCPKLRFPSQIEA